MGSQVQFHETCWTGVAHSGLQAPSCAENYSQFASLGPAEPHGLHLVTPHLQQLIFRDRVAGVGHGHFNHEVECGFPLGADVAPERVQVYLADLAALFVHADHGPPVCPRAHSDLVVCEDMLPLPAQLLRVRAA